MNLTNKNLATADLPLIVDLDGTFIRTDLLFEGLIQLLKINPLYLFLLPFWLLKGGKYMLKENIFKRVEINYKLLPINQEVYDFLNNENSNGRDIVLATASPQKSAEQIVKVFPVFRKAFGSDCGINLLGNKKTELLINNYGEYKFDYIGNSKSDISVFRSARKAYLVSSSKDLIRRSGKIGNLTHAWKSNTNYFYFLLRSIRVHQWLKNVLLFVPLVISHSFMDLNLISRTLLAFFAFSFIASAGYIINDLVDIETDRSHPRKKYRPFASGKIPILHGMVIWVILFSGGSLLALFLSKTFLFILYLYFIASIAYSLRLKKYVLIDTFLLTVLYTTRIISGGVVTDIRLTFWLIAFSIFIFLSLAFVKRFSELITTDTTKTSSSRRDYTLSDSFLVQSMGVSSGFISVIVLSLYINSSDVQLLYKNPKVLWLLCFFLLFYICRLWLVASRGKMNDDPIIYTMKDPTSYVIFFLSAIVMALSTFSILPTL